MSIYFKSQCLIPQYKKINSHVIISVGKLTSFTLWLYVDVGFVYLYQLTLHCLHQA